jgi:hypothetical protein
VEAGAAFQPLGNRHRPGMVDVEVKYYLPGDGSTSEKGWLTLTVA